MEYDSYTKQKGSCGPETSDFQCISFNNLSEAEVIIANEFRREKYPIGVKGAGKSILIIFNSKKRSEMKCVTKLRKRINRPEIGSAVANENKWWYNARRWFRRWLV